MNLCDFFNDPFNAKFKKLGKFLHEQIENIKIYHTGMHDKLRYEDMSEIECYYAGLMEGFCYSFFQVSIMVRIDDRRIWIDGQFTYKYRKATSYEKEERLMKFFKDTYTESDIAHILTFNAIWDRLIDGDEYLPCPHFTEKQKESFIKGFRIALQTAINKLKEIYKIE